MHVVVASECDPFGSRRLMESQHQSLQTSFPFHKKPEVKLTGHWTLRYNGNRLSSHLLCLLCFNGKGRPRPVDKALVQLEFR